MCSDRRKLNCLELTGGSKLAQAIKADTAAIAGIDGRVSVIADDIRELKTDEDCKATAAQVMFESAS